MKSGNKEIPGYRRLGDLPEYAAAVHGDRPFIAGPEPLSYAGAASRIRRIEGWLRRVGVGAGDRVMITCVNRVEASLLAFAAARVGAIFAMLHHATPAGAVRKIARRTSPAVVMLDAFTRALAGEFPGSVLVRADEAEDDVEATPFETILKGPPPDGPAAPVRGESPVCLFYTSGSTGAPRGIAVSHDNIRFSVKAIQKRLGYRSDDVIGLFLPMSFDYGLYQFFLAMFAGASILIGRPELAALKLASDPSARRITVLPGAPGLFAGVLRLPEHRFQPPPRLRCITNTGDHLPRAVVGRLRTLFPHVDIFLMYGLTECKRVSIITPGELSKKPGSVGRPLAGTEVYTVRADGSPAAPNETGELVVRGPHVALGYWGEPDETERTFVQKSPRGPRELFTGDLCRIDADGFIYFVGRADRLIKHRGFRMHPLEVEKEAIRIEGVTGAALLQTKNPDRLHLFASVADPGVDDAGIMKTLKKHLEPYKWPDRIHLLETLPRNSNHKIDFKRLSHRIRS